MLCRHDYSERLVSIFSNQIQSAYYGGNIFVSIEGIALEHFIASPHTEINLSTKQYPCHAVFHYFLSDDSKQYAATNTSHRIFLSKC